MVSKGENMIVNKIGSIDNLFKKTLDANKYIIEPTNNIPEI